MLHKLTSSAFTRRTFLTTVGFATVGSLIKPMRSLARNNFKSSTVAQSNNIEPGTLEVVAELPIRPALVTVNRQERIFATVHWFDRQEPQVIEITGRNEYQPYPNADWNRGFGQGEDAFDQPLGILVDSENRVWTVDCGIFPTLGDGQPPRTATLFCYASLDGDKWNRG